jgi:hypothetical protein
MSGWAEHGQSRDGGIGVDLALPAAPVLDCNPPEQTIASEKLSDQGVSSSKRFRRAGEDKVQNSQRLVKNRS